MKGRAATRTFVPANWAGLYLERPRSSCTVILRSAATKSPNGCRKDSFHQARWFFLTVGILHSVQTDGACSQKTSLNLQLLDQMPQGPPLLRRISCRIQHSRTSRIYRQSGLRSRPALPIIRFKGFFHVLAIYITNQQYFAGLSN